MDEDLNVSKGKEDVQCEDSGPQTGEQSVIREEEVLLVRKDAARTGIKTEAFAAGPGHSDGNSTKKTSVSNLIKCNICMCEMSSDLVLTSHINGSRHKKRMKALEIVANLKAAGERGVDVESDNGSNAYRCEVCSLSVNSPQQLEIHLAGAKHKNRVAKEKLNIVVNVTTPNNQAESINNDDSPPSKKRRKDRKFLYCDVCNIVLNSETQYEQHILSKKHLGRSKGDHNRKRRVNRLDNKPNFVQTFSAGSRFHSSNEEDGHSSQNDSQIQQFPSNNMNRLHQVQSLQNNRSNMSINEINNGPPFSNYFQPRPFMNNHRNFGRLTDMGKFFTKARSHVFNSHPDSVIQDTSSKS